MRRAAAGAPRRSGRPRPEHAELPDARDGLTPLEHAELRDARDGLTRLEHAELPDARDGLTRLEQAELPDARDGLTRLERIILWQLREAQKETGRESIPTPMLYGRVVEHISVSVEELQSALTRLVGRV